MTAESSEKPSNGRENVIAFPNPSTETKYPPIERNVTGFNPHDLQWVLDGEHSKIRDKSDT